VVHCSTASGTLARRTRSTALSSSARSLIPLDSRIGRPVAIMASSSGSVLTSPDPTFHIAMPTRTRRSTASQENGELRKMSPLSRAWSASPLHCASENSIRFQYS
jgi:hypothetical protein